MTKRVIDSFRYLVPQFTCFSNTWKEFLNRAAMILALNKLRTSIPLQKATLAYWAAADGGGLELETQY